MPSMACPYSLASTSRSGDRSHRAGCWWRLAAAVIAVLVFVSTAALGINAGYGLNPTLGAMLGLNQAQHLALPALNPKVRQDNGVPLWQGWTPPAGMPATGRSGAVSIPATASGF